MNYLKFFLVEKIVFYLRRLDKWEVVVFEKESSICFNVGRIR